MAGRIAVAKLAPAVPARDRFAAFQVIFLAAMHVGALAALWQTTWAAVGILLLLHAITGGLGICVGYHRLLTHRSFKCPRWLEYSFAVLGTMCLMGGPIEWVAQHRQHHQYPDQPGDPHSSRDGFWWSHMLWILWIPTRPERDENNRRYSSDLIRDPFYPFLDKVYALPSALLAVLLLVLGGWPFVVWGICVRLVVTYHCTWLVNSASHTFGYKNFALADDSTNCWWVALLSYGEGWHNNHHTFPTSARHGLRWWEIDLSYGFIRLLEKAGLAWELRLPPAEKLQFGPAAEASS